MPFVEDQPTGTQPAAASGFVPDEPTPTPAKPEESSLIPHWLKSAAIPTATTIGGGLLGAASPIPGGAIMGEMAGGGLGEKINQWLGITEPSKGAVVASAAAGPLGRVLGPVGRFGKEFLVKTFAGRGIMSEAADAVLRKWLSPAVKSSDLFAQAEALQTYVPAAKSAQAVEDILLKEAQRAPTAVKNAIVEAVEPLTQFFPKPSSGTRAVLAPDLMEEAQRLRFLASNAYEAGNSKLGNAINSVRGAILDDLEFGGAGVVKEASKAYRKEAALDDLSKLIGKPHPMQKVADFMRDNPLFRGAFDNAEKAQISRIAQKMEHVTPSGGAGIWGKTVTGGLGLHLGGVPGGMVGVLGPELIKKLLGSPWGRTYAEKILAGESAMDPRVWVALASFARGMTAPEPKKENQ